MFRNGLLDAKRIQKWKWVTVKNVDLELNRVFKSKDVKDRISETGW